MSMKRLSGMRKRSEGEKQTSQQETGATEQKCRREETCKKHSGTVQKGTYTLGKAYKSKVYTDASHHNKCNAKAMCPSAYEIRCSYTILSEYLKIVKVSRQKGREYK